MNKGMVQNRLSVEDRLRSLEGRILLLENELGLKEEIAQTECRHDVAVAVDGSSFCRDCGVGFGSRDDFQAAQLAADPYLPEEIDPTPGIWVDLDLSPELGKPTE